MDKRYDDVSDALQQVAAHRDKRLCETGAAISSARLQRLHRALASQFPVETSLLTVANKRDDLLKAPPELPPPVELFLQHRLTRRRCASIQRTALDRCSVFLDTLWATFRSPIQIAVTLLLIAFAIRPLNFARPSKNNRTTGESQNAAHAYPAIQEVEKFAYQERLENGFVSKSGDELTLRVGTIGLASLRPSFLTINRALFAHRDDVDRGLPLDLPIRQILIDADAANTP